MLNDQSFVYVKFEIMNSKDRIAAIFERKKCDRIPTDLGGTRKTGISVTALYHLRQCLGVELPARLYDVFEGTAETDEILKETTCCDVVHLPQPVPLLEIECLRDQTKKFWKPYAMEDGTGVLMPKDFYPERELSGDMCLRDLHDRRFGMMRRGGWRFERLVPGPGTLGMSAEDAVKEIAEQNFSVAFIPPEEYWEHLKFFLKRLSRGAKKSFTYHAGPPSPFLGGLGFLEPMKWIEFLVKKEPESEKLLEKWFELWMAQLEKLSETVGDAVNVLILDEDFRGIDPEAEEVVSSRILPFYARGIHEMRQRFGFSASILWQSEGNFQAFLPQLIEMGVNGISVADSHSGMDLRWIKKEFGKELVLWGGACSAADLAKKEAEVILEQVRENFAILSENGGYVHAVAGSIRPETCPENILTYFTQRG
ncbi:MAG: hypothetical protein E7028_05825 [Planctomycetaceae bacterium]|nr:hypothetical protein [Planctomycetaceae bacterium]